MSGFAEMDVLKSQLKTEDIEMRTIRIVVKDKGATNDNLEGEVIEDEQFKQGKHSYDDTMGTHKYNFQDAKVENNFNQASQTELFSLSAM